MAERVDYYSEDEYNQALQMEEQAHYDEMHQQEQQQSPEQYADGCLCELIFFIEKWGLDTFDYVIDEAKSRIEKKKKSEKKKIDIDTSELPF